MSNQLQRVETSNLLQRVEQSFKPPEFDSLSKLITDSLRESSSSPIHLRVLKQTVDYLNKYKDNPHWFCDPYMQPIASNSLLLFSYDTSPVLANLKIPMARPLQTCPNCLVGFAEAKAKLRTRFIVQNQTPISNVQKFINSISRWEISLLTPILDKVILLFNSIERHSDALVICVYWCMTNPDLLRDNLYVKEKFYKIAEGLLNIDRFPNPQELLPGLLYVLFEGNSELQNWGRKWIESLKCNNVRYNKETLLELVVLEFSIQLYNVQDAKFFSVNFAKKFWDTFFDVIDFIDDESFILRLNTPKDINLMGKFKNLQFISFVRLLCRSLLSRLWVQIPSIFNVFDKLLYRLNTKFWTHASEFKYEVVLNEIFAEPEYSKQLLSASEDDLGTYLSWISPFRNSLSALHSVKAATKIGPFLLSKTNNHENIRLRRVNQLHELGCQVLYTAFNDTGVFNDQDAADPEIALNNALELRSKIEYDADVIIRSAISSVGDTSSRDLLCKCLQYDMILLVHSSKLLLNGDTPKIFDCFPTLWDLLYKLKLNSNITLAKSVISCFAPISRAIMFKEVKHGRLAKEQTAARKRHNANMATITNLQKKVLASFSLGDQENTLEILNDPVAMLSIWACVFSPLLSQAALDFINEVYSASGRLETFRECLSKNLQLSLTAININLDIFTELKSYEQTPRTIRILMDIVQVLADPVESALASSPEECDDELLMLWRKTWLFLIMIFVTTPHWAQEYHLDEMREFTRDTLDMCHLLLDSFRIIVDSFKSPSANNSLGALFEVFMQAFPHLITWLKLGDTTLLNMCVSLVLKGFNLALEEQFPVPDLFITEIVKYGKKAKGHNNILSEPQRLSLIDKAKELNEDIIERLEIAEADTKKPLAIANAAFGSRSSSSRSPTPSSATTRKLEPIVKREANDDSFDDIKEISPDEFRQKYEAPVKQQTLTQFFKHAILAPTAPAPKVVKGTDSIANLRQKLQQSRSSVTPAPQPKFNPAPPRPAGFNPRKPATDISVPSKRVKMKKNTGDDSSSEEEEHDADFSDLFVETKKKAPKITQLDLNMRSIENNAYARRRKQMSDEEQAKERMRLRLNVNLKPLYTQVLKWNYNSTDDYPSRDRSIYNQIKDTYKDVKEYASVTEPLLMLECWQAIQSAKLTVLEKPFDLLVGTRSLVDGFFDVFLSIEKAVLQDRKISDTDLLVLAVKMEGITQESEIRKYIKSPNSQTCLAKVREIKYTNGDHCDLTLRVYPSGPMVGALTPKSVISAMRVMQMVTIEREFSSLKGLPYYDLADSIILATPNKPIEISDDDAENMRKIYRVNESQAKAIMGTYKSDGFSLIQGPPGTGKTKTILGIVGYSLSHQRSSKAIEIPGAGGTTSTTPTPTPPPSSASANKGKILICAPSNAAVDELVLRLRDGVINSAGEHMPLNVVRLGRSDAINVAVRDLTLEELVDKKLSEIKGSDVRIDPNITKELTKYTEERKALRKRLTTEALTDEEINKLEDEIHEVLKKRSQLALKLDQQREQASIAARAKETNRRNIQNQILSEAQVLCSTLSGSAHDLVANLAVLFDQVIIDEACQCLELSAIIPLRYGCKKCIMVGDPNQLPPTVLSQAAASYNYEQSLFVRMQKNNPESVYMLDVQYRMNPMISKFPSAEFYDSKLKDGEGMLELNTRPWHKDDPLTPYRFFDISGKHQKNALTQSLFNRDEARVALELTEKLMQYLPDGEFSGKVGIISPYKEQVNTIKREFIAKFGRVILNEIDFNTVDGFQGQEKEIIIMSCVRASESGSVGFLSDFRRMNVALTRAKTTLWILGNEDSLRRDAVWNRLLADATDRKCVSKAYPGFLAQSGNKRKAISNTKDQGSKKTKPNPNTNTSATTTERNVQEIRNNNSKPVPRPTNAGYLPNKKEPSTIGKNEQVEKKKQSQPKKSNSLAVPTKRPRLPKDDRKKTSEPRKEQDKPLNSKAATATTPKPYIHQPKPSDASVPKPYVNQPKPQSNSVPGPTRSGTLVRPQSNTNKESTSPAPTPPQTRPSSTCPPKHTPSSSGVVKPPPSMFIPRKRRN